MPDFSGCNNFFTLWVPSSNSVSQCTSRQEPPTQKTGKGGEVKNSEETTLYNEATDNMLLVLQDRVTTSQIKTEARRNRNWDTSWPGYFGLGIH